ncbi:hypothetical protein DC20_18995 [Rufibacter tibetensis]|uniref:Uncharacterized protein n=1 Tax=Rufibacter tibetensis TaxID=512763 RepID=A0A0P0CVG5_9BACT|nr:hypothetical protein DC20_18995 [Rufibacter tibetensis]
MIQLFILILVLLPIILFTVYKRMKSQLGTLSMNVVFGLICLITLVVWFYAFAWLCFMLTA